MPIKFNDVPLTPPVDVHSQVTSFWHGYCVTEFDHPAYNVRWQNHLPLPVPPPDETPRIGVLHWPTSASRWATCHAVCTSDQLTSLTGLIGDEYVLSITDNNNTITAGMYLLPPRPIAQRGAEKQTISGVPNTELYLLTFVDERFYWWQAGDQIAPTVPPTSWGDLFSYLFNAIGVTAAVDGIPSGYSVPTAIRWDVGYKPIPLLLDAAAETVGMRIVRQLDGTVSVQSNATAKASENASLNFYKAAILAGGTISSKSIGRSVPASCSVVFWGFDAQAITFTLAGLGISGYGGETGVPGSVGQVVADLPAVADESVRNAYALQAATDYYLWALSNTEQTLRGLHDRPLNGNDACQEWVFGPSTVVTRVLRSTFSDINIYGDAPPQRMFPAKITAVYDLVVGYAWERLTLDTVVPGYREITPNPKTGNKLFDINDDQGFQVDDRVLMWSNPDGDGWETGGSGGGGGAGCPVWYTAYHHIQQPEFTAGTILKPGDLIGYVAVFGNDTGAHLHFSLADGSDFLILDPESICGQTLDITKWFPFATLGTHISGDPTYYPPRFLGTSKQSAAAAVIKAVFTSPILGEPEDYDNWISSSEHKQKEYWANDIYPTGVVPGTGDQSMAGTPVYLAIKDTPEALNIVNEVVFAGFLADTVQYMVIVKHSACDDKGPIGFEITERYDPIIGYKWKKTAYNFDPYAGPKDQPYIVVDPPITGERLFEAGDNQSLVPGARGLMWKTPVGYSCIVQEEFPAQIYTTFNPIFGYDWRSTYDDNIAGRFLFEINGNVNLQPGAIVWVRRDRQEKALDTRRRWLCDRYILNRFCGFSYNAEFDSYFVDASAFAGTGLTVVYPPLSPPGTLPGCIKLNVAFPPPPEPYTGGCGIDVNGLVISVLNDDLAGDVNVTALVPNGACALAVDLAVADTTTENLVTASSLTKTSSGLQYCVTTTQFINFFNSAGLHIDRTEGVSTTVCNDINLASVVCAVSPCCTATPLVCGTITFDHAPGECIYFICVPVSGGVPPYTFFWDFGDGNTSTMGPCVTNNYTVDGFYVVQVTVTDACGNTCSASNEDTCVPPTDPCGTPFDGTLASVSVLTCPGPTLGLGTTWKFEGGVAGIDGYVKFQIDPTRNCKVTMSNSAGFVSVYAVGYTDNACANFSGFSGAILCTQCTTLGTAAGLTAYLVIHIQLGIGEACTINIEEGICCDNPTPCGTGELIVLDPVNICPITPLLVPDVEYLVEMGPLEFGRFRVAVTPGDTYCFYANAGNCVSNFTVEGYANADCTGLTFVGAAPTTGVTTFPVLGSSVLVFGVTSADTPYTCLAFELISGTGCAACVGAPNVVLSPWPNCDGGPALSPGTTYLLQGTTYSGAQPGYAYYVTIPGNTYNLTADTNGGQVLILGYGGSNCTDALGPIVVASEGGVCHTFVATGTRLIVSVGNLDPATCAQFVLNFGACP